MVNMSKEDYREYMRFKRLMFPGLSSKYFKIWRERNLEKDKARRKAYYESHKEQNCANSVRWGKENRDKVNAYSRKRYAEDSDYRMKVALRNQVCRALKRQRVKKTDPTFTLLGCSIEDFKIYLESKFESGMSWTNYGIGGWEIDHIMPCALFNLRLPEHRRRCFHFSNLQPLWYPENRRKGQIISCFSKRNLDKSLTED